MYKLILTFLIALPLCAQSTPQPTLPVYTSILDMLAHANPRGPQQAVRVLGYTSPGDGGGGEFYATNAVGLTNTGTCFRSSLNSTYAWMRVMDDIVNPQIFGAVGNGVADDTSKLRQTFDYVQSRGGGVISLGNNKVYNLASVTTSYPLYSFTNVAGVTIEGNGARFYTGTGTNYGTFLQFTGGSNITVRNVTFESGYRPGAPDNASAQEWLVFRQGVEGVKLENIQTIGGAIGVTFRGSIYTDGGWDTNRCRDIVINNFSVRDTYYGVLGQGAGDNMTVRGLKGINTGRVLYLANCKNVDAQVSGKQGGPFSDVLLKAYSFNGLYSDLENVRVNYAFEGRYPGAPSQNAGDAICNLQIQLSDDAHPTNSSMRNIDVSVSGHISASDHVQSIFSSSKATALAGTNNFYDVVGRGHLISGLRLHGVISGVENTLSVPVILFGKSQNDWTGDTIENVKVSDLVLNGDNGVTAGLLMDGKGFTTNGTSVVFDNVQMTAPVVVVNSSNPAGITVVNSHFPNLDQTVIGNVMNVDYSGVLTGTARDHQFLGGIIVGGIAQVNGEPLLVTSSGTPNSGETINLYHNGSYGLIRTTSFGSNVTPLMLGVGSRTNLIIGTNGLSRFGFGDVEIGGHNVIATSSETMNTGGTALLYHNGSYAGLESSFYTGSYMPLMFRTHSTNQMWLTTDGILVLTNAISTKGLTVNGTNVEALITGHTHPASDIVSGTMATARLGSGTASSSTSLRGDQTWASISGSGEANTASNLGGGASLFAQKSGVDLQFKSLKAGSGITITTNSTNVTVAATASAADEIVEVATGTITDGTTPLNLDFGLSGVESATFEVTITAFYNSGITYASYGAKTRGSYVYNGNTLSGVVNGDATPTEWTNGSLSVTYTTTAGISGSQGLRTTVMGVAGKTISWKATCRYTAI